MADKRRKTVMVRVPDDLVERLAAHAERLTVELRVPINRTTALERVLRYAFEHMDASEGAR